MPAVGEEISFNVNAPTAQIKKDMDQTVRIVDDAIKRIDGRKIDIQIDDRAITQQITSVTRALRGFGAFAAVTLATHVIKEGADAWKEYALGAISATEAVFKTISAIPILGHLADAAKSAADAILAVTTKVEKFAPGTTLGLPTAGQFEKDEIKRKAEGESSEKVLRQAQRAERGPFIEIISAMEKAVDKAKELNEQAAKTTYIEAKVNLQLAADAMERIADQSREALRTAIGNAPRHIQEGLIIVRQNILRAGDEIFQKDTEVRKKQEKEDEQRLERNQKMQGRFEEKQVEEAERTLNHISEARARTSFEAVLGSRSSLTGATGLTIEDSVKTEQKMLTQLELIAGKKPIEIKKF